MKSKMLLPLLAILIAASAAFTTKGNDEVVVTRWGNHTSMGCITGTLLNDTNCGIANQSKGRCIVEFDDESTAEAYNVSGCSSQPLYKQN